MLINNRIGTTQSYVSPPGSGIAFVKFRDVPLERVFSRMQQEIAPLGEQKKTYIFIFNFVKNFNNVFFPFCKTVDFVFVVKQVFFCKTRSKNGLF